jgi:hypothetical protein
MGHFAVSLSATPLLIGDDVAIINPLHSGGEPAYVDGDRRVRISSRALLARPRAVFDALCAIGAQRWTHREVAAAVVAATRYVRSVLRTRDQSR